MAKQKKKHIQLLSPENYIRQKARNLPIYKCWINTDWQEQGMAQVIVSRKHDNGNLTTGFYMVDLKCLGVRDSQYSFNRPEFELDEMLKGANVELEMINVDYNLAHNVLYAALEYADDLGFKAHKDFNSITKYILEEDTDDIELIEIECGHKGKPLFIKTEAFSEAETNRIIHQLERSVGKGNFDFIVDDSGLFTDDEDLYGSEFQTKPDVTFQFKIQLKNISKPTVWRRLLMPADATFEDFHDAIQIAFGWENSHLFAFSPDGYQSSPQIELESDDDSFSNYEKLNAETLTLDEIFTHEKQTYSYIYDFGDDWDHKITLEKIIPDQKTSIPKIIKAQGACPPEDCGGPWGYENLKEILADKKHPEHKEMKEWLGLSPRQHWDPEQFDMPEYQKIMDSVFGDLD